MEIIYLFDPLCGWCYGFGLHIQGFAAKHTDKIKFTVISGGMVTGERVGPLAHIASYIKDSVPRLEQLTGIRFGASFLNDLNGAGTTLMDSTPPSKAFVILKEQFPEQQLALAHALQSMYYQDGLDFNQKANYHTLCEALGMDFKVFEEKFDSVAYQLATKDEFKEAARYGVSGYPTVVLRHQDQYFMLAHGFASTETLESTFQSILQKEQLEA